MNGQRFTQFGVGRCVVEMNGKKIAGEITNIATEFFPSGRSDVTLTFIADGGWPLRDKAPNKVPHGLCAKRVVFAPPATVVYWADKTKTVVKCDPEDTYDRMTGLALCYMKKALGNTSGALNKALRNAEKGGIAYE